jgi:hypothetical protein
MASIASNTFGIDTTALNTAIKNYSKGLHDSGISTEELKNRSEALRTAMENIKNAVD